MQDIEKQTLTIKEFAAHMGVSELLVRRLIAEGSLRRIKLRRRVLIPKSELERFLESKAAA